jgi:uncharacterized protein (DUF2141 family)
MTKKICMTLLAMTLCGTIHAETPGGEIRVEVRGVRSATGDVKCALFDSPVGFPKQPTVKTTATIRDGEAVCTFAARPARAYAVAAFHDENGNQKLDTNFVGAPKEGFGFSNGARGKLSAPSFEAAKFTHDGTSTRVPIVLSY